VEKTVSELAAETGQIYFRTIQRGFRTLVGIPATQYPPIRPHLFNQPAGGHTSGPYPEFHQCFRVFLSLLRSF